MCRVPRRWWRFAFRWKPPSDYPRHNSRTFATETWGLIFRMIWDRRKKKCWKTAHELILEVESGGKTQRDSYVLQQNTNFWAGKSISMMSHSGHYLKSYQGKIYIPIVRSCSVLYVEFSNSLKLKSPSSRIECCIKNSILRTSLINFVLSFVCCSFELSTVLCLLVNKNSAASRSYCHPKVYLDHSFPLALLIAPFSNPVKTVFGRN